MISQIDKKTVKVKFLHRIGRKLTWPKVDDVQKLYPSQILCKMKSQNANKNKDGSLEYYMMGKKEFEIVNKCAKNCNIYKNGL